MLAATVAFQPMSAARADTTLLNVSYDPTREFYKDFNAAFAAKWKADTGETVTIQTSHGGSGKQARAVIDGLDADVVTLALESDISAIVKASNKINPDWRTKYPHNSAPYTSTIVFLVRKGNPKGIKDWGDLVKDGVEVITPNPKTSGGARWNYLAAWAWAYGQYGGDEAKIKEYIGTLFQHVPVLDTGARGSTTTFAQRELGDVLLGLGKRSLSFAWRNSATTNSISSFRHSRFWPSRRLPSSTRMLMRKARAKLPKPIFSISTRKKARHWQPSTFTVRLNPNWYQPTLLKKLPELKLVTIDDPIFGGWAKAQPYHFGDGGTFDQIYKPKQ